MPLVQRLFFIWKFFSLFFFWKDLEILKFFWIFFVLLLLLFYLYIYIYIYTHKQSSFNTTCKFWIQRNIKIWNKQTNFILNHDVANQMRTEAKLSHLLLLDPFRMLETWWAWTLIMMKWLGLALGMHASCELLAFHVDHANTPLMGLSVGLRLIQETNWASISSRVQL